VLAITYRSSKVSSYATVSIPLSEILVPLATDPKPSLVELTVQIISLPFALKRKVPPANTDVKLFSVLIVMPKSDLIND